MNEKIMRCKDCTLFGIPVPENNDTCGNCGSNNLELYYSTNVLAEREAQATEYRQRCLKAIKELEKLVEETNLENFSREARLNGKIEGIKLALSYFDEKAT